MSLTFKLLSLVIRTAAKPIGNYIKRQAKEHDGFRRFAVAQAQRVHRIDMRMRLGILHDPAAQERMHEREQRAAEEKKRKAETPTVRTAEEQKKFEEEQAREEKEGPKKEEAVKPAKIKIRPLSETRAIELGANFFSEAFIFGVAAGLLIWDAWRSRKKESARRDDVAERLGTLEIEVARLRSEVDSDPQAFRELHERIQALKQEKKTKWWNPVTWIGSSADEKPSQEQTETKNAAQAVKPSGETTAGAIEAPRPNAPAPHEPREDRKEAAQAAPEQIVVVKATTSER